jgi:ubiquinone biosynthesis protein UbiJ
VEASGDLSLAREILTIAQNLRWDYEEDLSRLFGDIVAHRLANAGRAVARWQRDSLASLARQAGAYWTEERPRVASRQDIEQFGRAVDTLRDDAARLEKRLEQLGRERGGHP